MKKTWRDDGIIRISMVLFLIILFGILSLRSVDATMISVDAPSQTLSGNQDFTINVTCNPTQAIKAFEFRISFNPSLLKANNVTEGTIFGNYSTFFNAGTINNNAGIISDIYSLIIGPGNVTTNGTFVIISFTAKDNSGTSSLDLNDVGVTDELGYIIINISDGSVTIQGSGGGGGGPPPPSGGYSPGPSGNEPPETPEKPTGPIFIERGVKYEYSAITHDPEGDSIRYRFDWGEGNMSNWSEFVESNNSISITHSWDAISTYMIKVIAQDENGLNSSWSPPLNITVSQFDIQGDLPIADFVIYGNFSTNSTIIFDGSLSFDQDGVIISYFWVFGDGKTGNDIRPSHSYDNSGEYLITLVVTDNKGNTCNKTMLIHIASMVNGETSESSMNISPLYIGLIITSIGGIILAYILYNFRDNIIVSLTYHKSHPIIHHTMHDSNKRIKRIDAKIEKLKRKMEYY